MPAQLSLLERNQLTLIPVSLLFMSGALAAYGLPLPLLFWLGWAGASALMAMLVYRITKDKEVRRCYLGLACLMAGGLYFTLFPVTPGPEDVSRRAGQDRAAAEGTLVNRGPSPNQWVLAVRRMDGYPVTGRVLVRDFQPDNHPPLGIGQTVRLAGPLMQPRTAGFPGDFDYRAYLLQQRMTAILTVKEASVLEDTPASWWLKVLRLADQVRNRIYQRFQQHLPSPEAELMAGVVLGEHAVGLEKEVKMRFIRSGLIHVLAASGFNVGLIGAAFLLLGKLVRLPLRVSLVMAMAGVAFYCMLTGLPPSVQRAGLMLELALMLKFFHRELRPLALLALTGLTLTLWNPVIVGVMGFQLSFISTLGLIVMVRPVQMLLSRFIWPWLAGIVGVPLVAQLWVTPLLWYVFSQVQCLALPANILALPLVAMMTYAGFVLGAVSLATPEITGWFMAKTGLLASGLHGIARWFGDLPGSVVSVASPPLAGVIWLYVLLFVAAYGLNFPGRFPARRLAQVLCAGLLLFIVPLSVQKWQSQHQAHLAWFSAGPPGHGTYLLQLPSGMVVLSTTHLNTYEARNLETFFRRHGIDRIDVLYVPVYWVRHLEGLPVLAKAVPIRQVLVPGLPPGPVSQKLIDTVDALQIPLIPTAATHMVESHDARITLYSMLEEAVLQRIETDSWCIALYWGGVPLSSGSLAPFARTCDMVADTLPAIGGHVHFAQSNAPPMALREFESFRLSREAIRMHDAPPQPDRISGRP